MTGGKYEFLEVPILQKKEIGVFRHKAKKNRGLQLREDILQLQ